MAEKRHCDRCDVVIDTRSLSACDRPIEGDDKRLGAFSLRVYVYRGTSPQHLDICDDCHRDLRSHRGVR